MFGTVILFSFTIIYEKNWTVTNKPNNHIETYQDYMVDEA